MKLIIFISAFFMYSFTLAGIFGNAGGPKPSLNTITICNNEDMTACRTFEYYPKPSTKENRAKPKTSNSSTCKMEIGDAGYTGCP